MNQRSGGPTPEGPPGGAHQVLIPKELTNGLTDAKREPTLRTNETAATHAENQKICVVNYSCLNSAPRIPSAEGGRPVVLEWCKPTPAPLVIRATPRGGPHYLACAALSFALFAGSRSVLVFGAPRGGGFVCT